MNEITIIIAFAVVAATLVYLTYAITWKKQV